MKQSYTILLLLSVLFLTQERMIAQSWIPQARGKLQMDGVYAISIVDSNTVWATASDEWWLTVGGVPAGTHKITILRTVDGGQTWQSHDFSDPYETGHGGSIGRMSFDLFAFDKDTAFMTTNDYNYSSALYMTTDGGENWTQVLEDLSAGVWVRFFNRREGVLIGGISDNYSSPGVRNGPAVSRTVDGGETWARVTLPASTTFIDNNYESLQGACQVIGTTIWFMAADGILCRSRDKGINWEMFSTPIDTTDIMLNITRTLAFADTLNGLALLATYNWATHVISNQFFRTSDGGATWTEFVPNGPMPQFNSIIPVPGTAQTFVGQGKEIPVSAVSTDFGQSWANIDDQYGYSCTAFLSPAIGWSSMFNGNQFYDSITPVMFKWQGDVTLVHTNEHPDPATCRIYPNPFTDRVYLECPATVDQYRLFTVTGSLVRSGEIGAVEASIDLLGLSADMYLLELRERDGRRTIEKLVRGY